MKAAAGDATLGKRDFSALLLRSSPWKSIRPQKSAPSSDQCWKR